MSRFLCSKEEKPEGLDEVMELWHEFKQETVVGPCTVEGGTPGSSEDESGEETVV